MPVRRSEEELVQFTTSGEGNGQVDRRGRALLCCLSLSALHRHSYLLLGFFWRAGRGHGHPWSPCSSVPGRRRRAEKKKKPKKVIRLKCTFRPKYTEMAETHRNTPKFYPRWNGGCFIPVCISVRDFPSVLARTERNIQLWLKLVVH